MRTLAKLIFRHLIHLHRFCAWTRPFFRDARGQLTCQPDMVLMRTRLSSSGCSIECGRQRKTSEPGARCCVAASKSTAITSLQRSVACKFVTFIVRVSGIFPSGPSSKNHSVFRNQKNQLTKILRPTVIDFDNVQMKQISKLEIQ